MHQLHLLQTPLKTFLEYHGDEKENDLEYTSGSRLTLASRERTSESKRFITWGFSIATTVRSTDEKVALCSNIAISRRVLLRMSRFPVSEGQRTRTQAVANASERNSLGLFRVASASLLLYNQIPVLRRSRS